MKQVIYNGGTKSYHSCSDPSVLTVGKAYNVLEVHEDTWQTGYTLEGVEGRFNSAWFDEVLPTYFAVGYVIPVVGKSYLCNKIVFEEGTSKPHMRCWKTSAVQRVECIGKDTYKVSTRNSVYVVNIM